MTAVGYTSGDPAKVDVAGDTMTGPLVLSGNPSTSLQAAPKQYVDSGDALKLSLTGGSITGDLAVSGRLTDAGWALPMLFPGRRPPWRDGTIVTNFQSGHGWTTAGTFGSSDLNATDAFAKGTQSAKVVTANSQTGQLRKLAMSAMDLTGKAIRVTVKVDNAAGMSNILFRLGTSSLSNYFEFRCNPRNGATQQIALEGDWIVFTITWAEVHAVAGTFSLGSTGIPSVTSGFTDMEFRLTNDADGPVTYHFQSVEIIDDTSATFPNGVCSIVFDDSWDNQFTLAKPKMDALGYRGTVYTIADAIGTSGRLTLANLKSLQNSSGWEVAGHAYTQTNHDNRLTSLTAQACDDELRNLRAWLVTNGFYGETFAYPGGEFTFTTDGVPVGDLVSRYFSVGRTILWDNGVNTNINVDNFPPAMPYRTRALTGLSGTKSSGRQDNPASFIATGGALDKISQNAGWVCITFHRVVSGTAADGTEISQTDFNSVMDAIAARGMKVLPYGDVVRYYS
jgi:peptidoglycan/xylan/chitin deacetylase (PgdA/CDA1 family)